MPALDRDLVYRISVANLAQAQRDLGTIADIVRRNAREEMELERTIERVRTTGRRNAASYQEKLGQAVARDQIKAADKTERERMRLVESSYKYDIAAKKREVKEYEKGEKDKTRIAKKEARERADFQRSVDKAQQNSAARQLSENARAYKKNEAAALQRARDAAFDNKRFYRGVGTAVVMGGYGAMRAVAGIASRGVRSIASGLGMHEVYDAGAILQQRFHTQQKLRYISQESAGGIDEEGVYKRIQNASRTTGINQESITGALDVASEKGHAIIGSQSIDRVAMEAKAYNANIEDIMTLRVQAMISAEQGGKSMSESKLRLMIAKMGALGKRGTFRLSEMAKRSPELFSRWIASGQSVDGAGLDQLVGFSEVARSASQNGNRAATSITQVQNAILGKEHQIDAMLGPHTVRDAETGAEHDPVDIMMRVLARAGPKGLANLVSGKHAIFDKRAMSAVNPFISAMQGHKTEEGRLVAMKAMLFKASNTAGITSENTDRDFAGAMNTTESRLNQAKETIKQSVEQMVVSLKDKLADKLPGIVAGIQRGLELLGPALINLGGDIGKVWGMVSRAAGGNLGMKITSFAIDHPLAAIVGGGALHSGGKYLALAAARRLGDALVDTVPGVGTTAFQKTIGNVGGNLLRGAGATPVYVTNWPRGGGGGGGIPGVPGGGGGIPTVVPGGPSGWLAIMAAAGVAGGVNVGNKIASGEDWDAVDYASLAAAAAFAPISGITVPLGYVGRKLMDSNREELPSDYLNEVWRVHRLGRALSGMNDGRIFEGTEDEDDGGFSTDENRKKEYAISSVTKHNSRTPQEKWERGDRGAFAGIAETINDASGGSKKAGGDASFDKFFESLSKAAEKLDILSNSAGSAGTNVSKAKTHRLPGVGGT